MTRGKRVSVSRITGAKRSCCLGIRLHGRASVPIRCVSLEVNWEQFQALGTVPFGLSTDPSPCKKAWAAVLSIEHVRLLSDFWPHGKVAGDYGILIEEFGMSQRANIIIDENGVVQWLRSIRCPSCPTSEKFFRPCLTYKLSDEAFFEVNNMLQMQQVGVTLDGEADR
jgi:hypothetical protein